MKNYTYFQISDLKQISNLNLKKSCVCEFLLVTKNIPEFLLK